jgi:hypothetical protein
VRIVTWLCLLAPWVASAAEAEWARERVGLLELETPRGHERTLIAVAKSAPGMLPHIEQELGVRIARRYRMVLIPPSGTGDSLMDDLDASVPPWAAGYMIPSRRLGAIRVSLASRYPYGTLESVLAHETTHLLLHDAAGERLPAWFQEGVATWIGRRWSLEDAMVYSSALLTTSLPHLSELDSLFQASAGEARLAYATSFSFVSWSIARYGPALPREVLREARSRPIADAWRAVTGERLAESERAWRRSSLIRYRWVPALLASSTLWLAITALALVAGLRRRAQAKRLRETWAREEGTEDGEGEPGQNE